MRLWTTMPKEVHENTILKNGVYICDPLTKENIKKIWEYNKK